MLAGGRLTLGLAAALAGASLCITAFNPVAIAMVAGCRNGSAVSDSSLAIVAVCIARVACSAASCARCVLNCGIGV